jgi:MFS family permease
MAPHADACAAGAAPAVQREPSSPSSPSTRIMVCGASFGGGPQRERKEGEPPSLEDHLNHCGVGWFQMKIFVMAAAIVAADGMEMTVISLLRKPLSKEWELDDDTFSLLGSTVFLGLLIGNLVGGYLADLFGRKKCIIGITVVFCVFGLLSAVAPDVYVFAASRFFTGVGVGSMVPVSDSHLLEWSPSVWRAKMAMTLTGVAFGLGAAFACVVGIVLQMTLPGDDNWWRYMLFLCVLPGVGSLPFVAMYFPESPHWLLVNRKVWKFWPCSLSPSLACARALYPSRSPSLARYLFLFSLRLRSAARHRYTRADCSRWRSGGGARRAPQATGGRKRGGGAGGGEVCAVLAGG